MRHIDMWSAALYNNFVTFSHKRNDFRKKILLSTKRAFWFFLQVLSETFLI